MGKLTNKSDYEELRNARISVNKARMESMGLLRSSEALRSVIAFSSPAKKGSITAGKRPWSRRKFEGTPRRSTRLMKIQSSPNCSSSPLLEGLLEEEKEVRVRDVAANLFPGRSSRGVVYDSVFGICCHFCRQKTLCGEDDCERCVDRNINKPCIGKTECSSCHSSNGVLCRACLRIRYGEEMEKVRADKNWMCPHCIEEKGVNPYWICNSSFCLKRRKMIPTGIAIYQARELGYKSVAHLIMDKLKKQDNCS